MLLLLLTGQAVQSRQSVQLYSHTQVSASLHCISERLTFLFAKAWDFETFWLRIQIIKNIVATGRRVIHRALKKKSANLVQFFFKITPGGKIRRRGQV